MQNIYKKIIILSAILLSLAGFYFIGNQPQSFGITIPKLDLFYLDGSDMKPRGSWDLNMGLGDVTATEFYGSGTSLTGVLHSYSETDPLSLHLNQATPQTIINGIPIFDSGLTSNGVIRLTPNGTGNIIFNDTSTNITAVFKTDDQATTDITGNGMIFSAGKGNGIGAGGSMIFYAGHGGNDGMGGDFNFYGGNAGTDSDNDSRGGALSIYGGSGNQDGDGGEINIFAGDGGEGGSDTGGNVYIQGGYGTTLGKVYISDPSSGKSAILDTSLLATSDKTFTFPNLSGTLALTNDTTTWWSAATAQTGLTGDKTGTFNLTTTGTLGAGAITGTIGRFTTGIYDNAATPLLAIGLASRYLYDDSGSNVSINWNDRILYATGGDKILDWGAISGRADFDDTNILTSGTLGAGVGTLSGGNGNATFALLNLNNTANPATGNTAQTSDSVFNLMGTINSGSTFSSHEAAKISAYKVSDWWHASAEADHDSGLKFYTTSNGTPTLQLTIDDVGLATFVGNITSDSPATFANITIGSGSITEGFGDTISFGDENITTGGRGTFRKLSCTDCSTAGDRGVALGFGSSASADYGTAMGASTVASGVYSTAMGANTIASADYSTAMGYGSQANAMYSTAMGFYTTGSGDYAIAMGQSTIASGDASTAMGSGTTASGGASTAMGSSTTASGSYSTAMGAFTVASGNFSIAMGGAVPMATTASGHWSTAIGYQLTASGNWSFALGKSFTNDIASSFAVGFGQKDFAVSAGLIDIYGLINTYNSIATVSNGVPSELAKVDLTGQTAAKSATTIYTPTTSGMFRISISLQVTTAATTSSVLGGATGITITYTEPDGSVAQSIKPLLTSEAGAVIIPATGNIGNATTTQSQGSAIIYAKTGVAIQYAIGYTSVGATAMQYSAHLKVEAL